jgi:uncharacterized membrane protein
VLIGALPFVAWLAWWSPLLHPLASALDPWFAWHCHRVPHRTLELAGQRLPVCARCTGIYAGLLFGAALAWPRASTTTLARLVLASGGILLLDVLTEAAGWRIPSLATRFLTGAALAYPAALAAARRASTR